MAREAHLECSCFARASLRVFSLCSVRCAVMRFACADAIVDVPKNVVTNTNREMLLRFAGDAKKDLKEAQNARF